MASPHTPYHPQPGPSYYHHPPPPPPPPHYAYSPAPGPAPFYAYPMPPMNGHAPMHQPASPRVNGAGRGRFPPHRGGGPAYYHQGMPPQHHMPPPAMSVHTPPPASPASPFHHPQKFPPHSHPHQVPYGSPYHHPQPNGPYPPAWSGQTLSPLPKQFSMLPPMISPEHVPQQQQHPHPPPQVPPPDIQPQSLSPPSQGALQVVDGIPPQLSPAMQQVVSSQSDAPEQTPTGIDQQQSTSPAAEEQAQPEDPEQAEILAQPPIESIEEHESVAETQHIASNPLNFTSSNTTPISIYAVWTRRPRNPDRAPGVIISSCASPPVEVLQKALDQRTPPPSPKLRHVIDVQAVVPLVVDVSEVSPETTEASSSATDTSTTVTTPAGSIAADTPVPGSPYSCATSVSAAVGSPPAKAQVSTHPETRIELPPSVDAAVKVVQPVTPVAERAGTPATTTPAAHTTAPKPAAAVPMPMKPWASLFSSSDSPASSSKPRLPVSNVVGFSVPAASSTTTPSSSTASIATVNRNELLHLLNSGPFGTYANVAAAMKIHPRGLINPGNMCFANAVLQILVYCPPFHRFFSDLRRHLAGPVVGSQREGTKATPLVDAMIQFMKEFVPDPPVNTDPKSKSKGKEREEDAFEELDSFVPTYVYDAMKEKKRFATMIGGHQEDAEEFLGFFLDALEEELLSITQSLQPKDPAKKVEEEASSQDGWMEVGKKNRAVMTRMTKSTESPVTRIFGGKFRSTLHTPHQRDSATVEDWRSLQLDIQPENVKSLRDALQHISHPQQVQISIPTRPGAILDATQQVLIEAFPQVLIMHMKRFLYDTKVGDVVKVSKQVSFSPELDVPLDIIAPAAKTAQPVKYQLFGVLYHHGPSASGGHYTLDVLHPNRELSDRPRPAWIRIDDELVSDVRAEDVFGGQDREDRQPYLLFYRRMSAWGSARTN